MKLVNTSAVALVGVALIASSALAADLPTPPPAPPPVPAPVPAPAFSWTGFYVGVHGGYAWGAVVADRDFLGFTAGRPTGADIDATTTYPIAGAFGGLNAGFNFQAGPLVLGVNGEINLARIAGGASWPVYGDANDSVSSLSNWFGSVAARAGLAFGQFHAYGLAGWAFGNFTHTLSDPLYVQSVTAIHMGPVYGGGVEYATARGLVISVEYRRHNFDAQSLGVPGGAGTIWFGDRLDFTPTINTVRLGISKLF